MTEREGPPVERVPRRVLAGLGPSTGRPGAASLLLVGHGSRRAAASTELLTLLEQVRGRVPGAVAGGWIELAEPAAATVGRDLVDHAAGATLVVQPLLFTRAFHARFDLPAVLADVRAARPDTAVVGLPPLLLSRTLVELACARVRAVAGPRPAASDALLVVPSGSSDPSARAQGAVAAKLVGRRTGHVPGLTAHAFASGGGPDVAEAVAALAARGARALTVLSWSLFAGRLVDGVAGAAEVAAARAGLVLRWAGRFGPDAGIADLVARRHRAAVARLAAG